MNYYQKNNDGFLTYTQQGITAAHGNTHMKLSPLRQFMPLDEGGAFYSGPLEDAHSSLRIIN
jgi:hypothetical protein